VLTLVVWQWNNNPLHPAQKPTQNIVLSSSSSLLLSSLELSATQVFEPEIRALVGTDSQFCEIVVLGLSFPEYVGITRPTGADLCFVSLETIND